MMDGLSKDAWQNTEASVVTSEHVQTSYLTRGPTSKPGICTYNFGPAVPHHISAEFAMEPQAFFFHPILEITTSVLLFWRNPSFHNDMETFRFACDHLVKLCSYYSRVACDIELYWVIVGFILGFQPRINDIGTWLLGHRFPTMEFWDENDVVQMLGSSRFTIVLEQNW